MRHAMRGVLFSFALLTACGGSDANEPEPPFPDVAGVYDVSGGFDGIPTSVGSFAGTLELTQASRSSGTLQGSAAILATIDGSVFNVGDASLANANVSPAGVLSFTMADNSGTWTFSGTYSSGTIGQGRHTLSSGGESLSGNWQGTRAAGSVAAPGLVVRRLSLEALGGRVARAGAH
ncbi:MAG TPA: hypothetical protein VMN37_09620 [Gemmatimonadales bacterium]|nr:hypothetical protein [Gemmatimonadales bacterium]